MFFMVGEICFGVGGYIKHGRFALHSFCQIGCDKNGHLDNQNSRENSF